MICTEVCKVISAKNFPLSFKDLSKSKDKKLVLVYNQRKESFDSSSVNDGSSSDCWIIGKKLNKGEILYKLSFQTTLGAYKTILCDEETLFYTKRGFITASKLNSLDVCLDSQGRHMKMTFKRVIENENSKDLYGIKFEDSDLGYFVNGILVKDK